MSTAMLFYFSLGSFALIILMTGVMFVRYQLLYLRLLEQGMLTEEDAGESSIFPQLRIAKPKPDVALPAGPAEPPAAAPAAVSAAAPAAKAAPAAAVPAAAHPPAPAAPSPDEENAWNKRLRTAILSQSAPAELVLGNSDHNDDSDETGRWFVENREVLERLHSQLRGHKSTSGRRRASLVQAAKSLAGSIGGKDSPAAAKAPPPKAPPSAAASAAPADPPSSDSQVLADKTGKRPTLLVKHSSMAKKIKHDDGQADSPPPAAEPVPPVSPIEVRQPSASTPKAKTDADDNADGEKQQQKKKKRPTLLVKHKPGEIPSPPPVADGDE